MLKEAKYYLTPPIIKRFEPIAKRFDPIIKRFDPIIKRFDLLPNDLK